MDFFQKNKSVIIILLMVSFFLAILLIFVSGITGSKSDPTPTSSVFSEQSILATSTNNLTLSTPVPTNAQGTGAKSSQTPAKADGTLSPTQQSSGADVPPGTDAPPPPTFQGSATDVPPGTNAPPPPTQSGPTQTPPAGNGPPPGT